MAEKEFKKELKVIQQFRFDPQMIKFIEEHGKEKRWTKTTVIEVALEEYAKKVGYELSK